MPPKPLPERLTSPQQEVVTFPREGGGSLFLHGLPGTGKSTALRARLAALLREGRRPYEILVLLPQRAQVESYEELLATLGAPTRGGVDIVTFYSLTRRAVALFWPLVARAAGFAHPDHEPTFLTIETTQYFMWRLVEPLIRERGYFRDLSIRRGRLLSQLIDNLNKSALVGFDHTDIYRRLRGAWAGKPEHLNTFMQAQDCAVQFRAYCLAHNLLDFSLVTEVYHRYLLPHEVYRRYFHARYRHLLVDNLEENVPVAHDLVRWAREQVQSTVLALDEGGGYRVFLGADAQGAQDLGASCGRSLAFATLAESTGDALAFSDALHRALRVEGPPASPRGNASHAVAEGLLGGRFWISMIRSVTSEVRRLVTEEGASAGEIALIAPYVSEVMRFAVEEELGRAGIALRLVRPATTLRDEPVIRALLALMLLGHPGWTISLQGGDYSLPAQDVALALQVAISGLDPVRARLLAREAVALGGRELADLGGAETSPARAQELGKLWETIGYQVRERYQTLREWLAAYRQGEPQSADLFLTRLFGDLLSRPGYGFHDDATLARAYGRLVESARKFREAVGPEGSAETQSPDELARQYVELILGGIASAEYLIEWPRPPREAVVLAPAYAYLTRDIRSRFQFWLDLGSDGWWNRPNQPLTHPFVLSRYWEPGRPWTDTDEERTKREALGRVLEGLAARCTGRIYLAASDLGIDGEEQRGRLQHAVMLAQTRMMRHE